MRLPSFTSNNKRCEVPSLKHLRYIQNVSCVLKFKFNLTAYVTQQSYPKNTRTELEWKRNCRNEALEGKRVGRLLFTYTSEGGPELTSRCCCGVVLPSQSSWSALDGYSKCTWPDCHDSSMTTCNEASECSCSFDSGQCCGHCECCGFIFVVLVLLLTKVPENTAWLLVISCKNVQIGSVSGCSLMNLHFPSTLNPNQPTHGLSQKFYFHAHSLTLPGYSQAKSAHHLISALTYFSLRFL